MLIRIVRLSFEENRSDLFLEKFHAIKKNIRNFEGCHHLELWEDYNNPNIFSSHSVWDSEESLNNYRHSEFFREMWSEIKPWFADKPQVFSFKKKFMVCSKFQPE